jgi:hypothetical protein
MTRYAVVRIDNGPHSPHTGLVSNHRTRESAEIAIETANTRLNRQPGQQHAWHPYAILDRQTGETSKVVQPKSEAKTATTKTVIEDLALTQQINKLQKRHPGTRRQRSSHGCNRYSVQFFAKADGKLVADYNL